VVGIQAAEAGRHSARRRCGRRLFVKTLRVRTFLRRFLLGMRRVFVFLPRWSFAAIENIRQPRFNGCSRDHRVRSTRGGNLMLALRHRRGGRRGRPGFLLQKIIFQRGNVETVRGGWSRRDRVRDGRLGNNRRIDGHAHNRPAVRARNSFIRVVLIALNMLPARRTGKFQITHKKNFVFNTASFSNLGRIENGASGNLRILENKNPRTKWVWGKGVQLIWSFKKCPNPTASAAHPVACSTPPAVCCRISRSWQPRPRFLFSSPARRL
jgi:hypothetical protein